MINDKYKCPFCGNLVNKSDLHCANCGGLVSLASEKVGVEVDIDNCPYCNLELEKGCCPKCGYVSDVYFEKYQSDNRNLSRIVCPYCHGYVNRTDLNCPNCGAKIEDIFNYNYRNQLGSNNDTELFNKYFQRRNTFGIIIGVLVGFIITCCLLLIPLKQYLILGVITTISLLLILLLAMKKIKYRKFIEAYWKKNKSSIKPSRISIFCDRVANYKMNLNPEERYFETFHPCPEGCIPLAFHLIVNNYENTSVTLYFEPVILLVNDIAMKSFPINIDNIDSDLKDDKFSDSGNQVSATIYANSTHTGWVGFYVPRDAKRFEFRVAKEIFIMDNPLNR